MRTLPISIVFLSSAALLQLHCSATTTTGDGAGSNKNGSSSGGTSGAVDSGSSSTTGDGGLAAEGDGGTSGGLLPDGAAPPPPTPVINFVSGVTVSTLAGSSQRGNADGVGAAATFSNPTGIKIDQNGNLVVTDYDGWDVRLVTPAGSVSTLVSGAGGFSLPFAVTVADDGSYFVSTDADLSDAGTETTLSGAVWSLPQGSPGALVTPSPLCQDMGRPRGIAPAVTGDLFVVERVNNQVGTLNTSTGVFTAWAGSTSTAGYQDGTGTAALFNSPLGGARMPDGSFVVADSLNGAIRRVTSSGVVTTIAGNGVVGMVDGPCSGAHFGFPHDVAVDAAGNLYVSDGINQRIRRIRMTGGTCIVETLAGNGTEGFADGPGNTAAFYGAEGLDVSANGLTVYVADGDLGDGSANHRIRMLAVPPIGTGEDAGTSEDAGSVTGATTP